MGKWKIHSVLVENGKPVGRAFVSHHIEAKTQTEAARKAKVQNRDWAKRTHSETPLITKVVEEVKSTKKPKKLIDPFYNVWKW